MKMRSAAPITVVKAIYIAASAALAILGTLFVFLPAEAIDALSKALGILMLVFAVARLFGYFTKDLYRLAFQYDLQFGILMMVLGMVMIVNPRQILNLTIIAMGIVTLADALFKLKIALDSKKFGISQWWLILAAAALAAVIGIFAVFSPWDNAKALAVIFGFSLIAEGLLNLTVAILTVKIVKNQYPDGVDEAGS